jgi:hypothetical protein
MGRNERLNEPAAVTPRGNGVRVMTEGNQMFPAVRTHREAMADLEARDRMTTRTLALRRLREGRFPAGEYHVCVNAFCAKPAVVVGRLARIRVSEGAFGVLALCCAECETELYEVGFDG